MKKPKYHFIYFNFHDDCWKKPVTKETAENLVEIYTHGYEKEHKLWYDEELHCIVGIDLTK